MKNYANLKTNKFSAGIRFSAVVITTAFFLAAFVLALPFAGTNTASAFAPGDLDAGFGNGGKVTTPIGATSDLITALAVQTDGKIIAAGISFNGLDFDFAVVRYNADGSLDTSFGSGGKVTTAVGSNTTDSAADVALQPDGKIIVAGGSNGNPGGSNFAVVRYHADGSLDSTFGTGGKVVTPVLGFGGDNASAVAILANGKILLSGMASSNNYALVRYNADGSLDTGFGTGGKVITNNGSSGNALGMLVQPDNKIVVAGYLSLSFDNAFAIVRYNADGTLDTSFGTNGKVTTQVSASDDIISDIALQPDGKIVAVGWSGGNKFTAARYTSSGALDSGFGTNGLAVTPIGLAGNGSYAAEVAIQTNGKIVAVGDARGATNTDFAVVRYNADGTLDSGFGTNGAVITPVGTGNDIASAVAIQPDGRILAGGTAATPSSDFGLVRYLGDAVSTPSAPFDFDGDAKTDISIFRPSVGEWWYLRSSNGTNYAAQFGSLTDRITPADFTGDGKTDIAFWRPSTGQWFILRSEDQSFYAFPFGTNGDTPVPGDYDGDGKADAAVFRPSNQTWFIQKSSGGTTIQQFGTSGDIPTPADYDGDGKADIAIFRPAVGEWWIQRSSNNSVLAFQFGNAADKPVQGKYTGDNRADAAFFRPSSGQWFVLRSEDFSFYAAPFGSTGDIPTPGDYDGDGRNDLAVFRPSNSTWFVQRTTAGTLIQAFGISGDKPVPNAFVP